MLHPVGALRNENRQVVDCAGIKVAGLAASERRNASLGLHQGTLQPSSSAALPPLPLMPARAVCVAWRSETGSRRTRRMGRCLRDLTQSDRYRRWPDEEGERRASAVTTDDCKRRFCGGLPRYWGANRSRGI